MNLIWFPVVGFLFGSQQAAPTPALVPRIAFEDSAQIDPARLRQMSFDASVPIAVRVQAPGATDAGDAFGERLAAYRRAGVPLWLSLRPPASVQDAETWRRWLATVLQEHGDGIAIVEIALGREQAALGVFAVKLAATEARSARPAIRIALGGALVEDASALSAVYTEDLAPYIDLLVVSDASAATARPILARVDSSAKLAVAGLPGGPAAGGTRPRLMDLVIDDLGTDVSIRSWQAADPAEELRALAPAAALLKSDISRLDAAATKLRLSIGDRDVTDSYRFRVLFDERTFATYLVYWGDARPEPLHVAATLSMGGTPVVHDLLRGTRAGREQFHTRRCDRVRSVAGAADRRTYGARFQRRRHRDVRGSKRRVGGAGAVRRRDHRAAPGTAARAGLRRSDLFSRCAHGAALPGDDGRFGLRRRHREPLLRQRRGHRMGRAFLFGQRREVGSRPSAISAPSGRKSVVAPIAASLRHGLSLRVARNRRGG